jgi:hypothetical protein
MYKLGGWVSVLQQQQQRWVCQYGTLWEAPSSLSTVGGDANNNKKSIVVQFVNWHSQFQFHHDESTE